jgi:hypothetical protein
LTLRLHQVIARTPDVVYNRWSEPEEFPA